MIVLDKKYYSNDWKDYKFEKNNIVKQVTKSLIVSESDIATVIINCLEGGSHYWLGVDDTRLIWKSRPTNIPYSIWITQMLLEGETIHFYDIEDEKEVWGLNLDKLIKGFKINARKRPFDKDLDKGDYITSDCILQYGLFGELMFV